MLMQNIQSKELKVMLVMWKTFEKEASSKNVNTCSSTGWQVVFHQ